jgi:hypothetical protein
MRDEEKKMKLLKNELIEINLTAKEGLVLLNKLL